MPRLASYRVLEECIQRGLPSEEYFAYAAAVGENRYIDLKYNQAAHIERSGFLVRASEAKKQVERERAERDEQNTGNQNITKTDTVEKPISGLKEDGTQLGGTQDPPPSPKSMRFFLSAPLDNTRVNRDVQRILEEIFYNFLQNVT